MIECTRRIEFDAGHRVVGHQNKCQFLHGHRYALEVTVAKKELDYLGMVIDFGTIKTKVKEWIDTNFDHSLILNITDKALGDAISDWTGQKIYYLEHNPTAENIALHLKIAIIPKLLDINENAIIKVKLFETPNSFVEV